MISTDQFEQIKRDKNKALSDAIIQKAEVVRQAFFDQIEELSLCGIRTIKAEFDVRFRLEEDICPESQSTEFSLAFNLATNEVLLKVLYNGEQLHLSIAPSAVNMSTIYDDILAAQKDCKSKGEEQ